MGLAVPLSASPRAAERRGLLLGFGAFGAFWGSWAALLPDLRAQVGVDDGRLGLALAAVALTALPAMPLTGRLVDRSGAARLAPLTLVAFALVVPLAGFSGSYLPFVLALLALGATTGALDVVLNTATAAWERLERDRLMAGGHGCFSLGVLGGSVLTGLAREVGAGPRQVLPVLAVLLLATAAVQPRYRQAPAEATAPGRSRLGPVLLLLGALIAGAFLVEDALQSWSALHLERGLGGSPAVGGLGPGAFAAAMAAGRLATQGLGRRLSETALVAGGGALAAVGALVLAAAPSPAVGVAGLLVAGAGTSVLAPVLFSAVGARSAPGRQGADLAAVTALGYAGFVAGPPLVGLVSGATSLPTALALLALVGAAIALVGPVALRQRTPVEGP